MIITRLEGGLGAQMFQYAIGRQIADTHQTLLKLDLSVFELDYEYRKYGLHCFNIQAYPATPEDIDDTKGIYGRLEKISLKITRKLGFRSSALRLAKEGLTVQEKQFHFDANVLKSPKNTYLHGWWQSEKYFSNISEILRKEFHFKYLQDLQNKCLSDLISNTNSIAIHIRRGDYTEPIILDIHGICSLDYYDRAVQLIINKVSDPHFFIFSDDPKWVKENLKLNFPITIIDHNHGDYSYEDMRLMSQCKHQIIANSTFSWWAAWLNENPNKIIIAPQKWFNDSSLDTSDLIPISWLKI